jgi:hypothetical protein
MKKAKKKAPKKKAPKKKPAIPADSGIEEAPKERVMIVGDYQNAMWKKGKTQGGSGEGCKVFVPKRFSDRLRNKVVECERVDENGETYYKYLP